ncbi:hypothetical protein OJP13_05560 [Campylobacter lari]|uniref:hypothetical protein n=1 Tax=Campylobacter lari TaxID=201 RepID=UPI0021E690A9|nr:hypothetical protein [Campylobacter lari]MCV3379098.1 hypothetical protein [Campylobacter lari]MCV3477123.1 hypothetical protein [Campylobacter lari]MCW0260887.1 hypothetical protein [Campylobacter lari]
MKEIKKFIDNCLNPNNFEIASYDYQNYKMCEISKICFLKITKDVDGIINFWKEKDKEKYFELQHPIYNNIKTRAVYASNYFIILIDPTNSYIWAIFQDRNICDCIIIENTIFTLPCSDKNVKFDKFPKVNPYDCCYRDIEFGYVLNGTSPWHYFYEQLAYFYLINSKKSVLIENCYYLFDKYKINATKDSSSKVYLYPKVVAAAYLYKRSIEIFSQMGKAMYDESVKESREYAFSNQEYDLTIWLSLVWRNGTGKTWVEQLDGTVCIVTELSKVFKKILILIDGNRNFENMERKLNQNVENTIQQLTHRLIKFADVISLNNTTFKKSIYYCSKVDIAISETGSGAIVPFLCCNKPGVLYGNQRYLKLSKVSGANSLKKVIDPSLVKEIENNKQGVSQWVGIKNYSIHWRDIFNLIVEILICIKRINVKESQLGLILYSTAKSRIQNQLSYKLGQAMIINSKSLFGYIKMPFVLSYIKDKHNQEQKIYKEKIKKDPSLKLPPLEDYPDYQEALKEKECLTYKLGQALIKANKTWYKGGYVKLWFEIGKLKKEVKSK